MPRRMITSEIFFNEKVGSLPPNGRLLFIGVFSNADDDGRMKASPKFLKARIFPYDEDVSSDDVRSWRDLCAEKGLIRLYGKDSKEYLDIPGWLEHQLIRKDRYKESSLPSYQNADQHSVLNQPWSTEYSSAPGERSHYEKTFQHEVAQKLQENQWCPTGEKIVSVETNKRVGNLYADILAITENGVNVVIELKAYPLQPRDLGQIVGYMKELATRTGAPVRAFLAGSGLGNLDLKEAEAVSVTILNHELKPLNYNVDATCGGVKLTPNNVETAGLRSIGEGRLGEVSLEREIPSVSLVATSATPNTEKPPKNTNQKQKQVETGIFLDMVEQHIGTKLVQRSKHIGQIRPLLVKFPEATPESLLDCFKWLKQHDPYCQARDSPMVISMLPSKYPEWAAGKLSVGGQPRGSPRLPTADELKSQTRKFMKGEK